MITKEFFIMSNELEEELIRFATNHPAKRFSKNLRDMLVHYTQINFDDGLPNSMKDTLFDLMGLFAVLDKLEDKDNWLVADGDAETVKKYAQMITDIANRHMEEANQ